MGKKLGHWVHALEEAYRALTLLIFPSFLPIGYEVSSLLQHSLLLHCVASSQAPK